MKNNSRFTSSMGRLFAASAALAGVRPKVNYEGQAKVEFKQLADPIDTESYPFALDQGQVGVRAAFEASVKDVLAGTPISMISAKFHRAVR